MSKNLPKATVYLWLIILTGAGVTTFYLTQLAFSKNTIIAIALFTPLAFVFEVYEVRLWTKQATSVSTAIYIGAVILGGGPLAISIAIPALFASELIIRYQTLESNFSLSALLKQLSFNTFQIVLSIAAASSFISFINAPTPSYSSPQGYIAPLLAVGIFTIINICLVAGIVSLTEEISFYYQLKAILQNLHIQLISLGVLAILIPVLYTSSPFNVLLISILLILINVSLRNYMALRREAKNTFEQIMDLLSKRDPYTANHSEEVGDLTEAICHELNLPNEKRETIVAAARVHDIGKLGIPDDILLKPGDLTEEEWEVMERHPEIGANILSELDIYRDAIDIVKHEHERWNGSGYPEGLSGDAIPLGSQIVAAADIWNALTTERPYRGPLSKEEAIREIKDSKGKELSPRITNALLEVVGANS